MGHEEADLGGGEELARALTGTFGKFAEQVLVGAAQEVGLHVGQAEPVSGIGEGLHHVGELGRVEVALAVALGGEIDEIDDARKRGILPHNRPHSPGQMLADVAGPRASAPVVEGPRVSFASADDSPAGFRRQVEAQQIVVIFRDLLRDLVVSKFLGQAIDLVVEDVRKPFEKEKRQQVVLELGRVFLPADGTGRVPKHLLHGFGGRSSRPAPAGPPAGHPRRCFGGFRNRFIGVDSSFGSQRGDGFARRLLGLDRTAFPAIDSGEGDPETPGKLLLGEIEVGADGAQRGRNGV